MCDCVHPARMLQRPRRCRWTRGPERVFVADCATARGGCGQIVVIESEAPQNTKEHAANVLHRGGPLAESESVSSRRVMTSNLNGG